MVPTMMLSLVLLLVSSSSGFHVVRRNETGIWHEIDMFSFGNVSIEEEKADTRIIGGTVLGKNSWQFLAMLGLRKAGVNNRAESQWCGAAILGPRHVLTAAHCVDNRNIVQSNLFIVVAGEHTHQVPERTEQYALIDKYIMHPGWDKNQKVNDLAVLKLASPLRLGGTVGSISLNTDGRCPRDRTMCTVAGWGRTPQNPDTLNDVPLVVNVPVWGQSSCAKYPGFGGAHQICAGRPGMDICKGDSGSPLICNCGGMKVAGVVSYTSSTSCGKGRFPSVYARVSHYVNWIQGAMRQ